MVKKRNFLEHKRSSIFCVRRGVSAIVFIDLNGKREYLLLKRKLNWKGWEFLKGGKRENESEWDCLKREIKEEAGISKFKAKKTKYIHEFKYKKEYMKDSLPWIGAKNRIYLVRVFQKKIKIDKNEHSGLKWVDKKTALKLITWNDYGRVFKKVAV